MSNTINAPSRYWVVMKRGTVVARFNTAGETAVEIPDSCNTASVPEQSALTDREIDTSVLTGDEKDTLGILE